MVAPPIARAKTKADGVIRQHAPAQATHRPAQFGSENAGQAYLLQRSIGNRATHRLLVQRFQAPAVQTVDSLERDADAVADRVMRMPVPHGPNPTVSLRSAITGTPQLKAIAQPAISALAAPPLVNDVLHQPGQPLDSATRGFFEPRFGHDLRSVRVHADARAAASADALQARAYAVGTNIVFGPGEYQPATAGGKHLLAHELAHTVQQSGSRAPAIHRKLKVGAGLTLNTLGFSVTKSGNVYTSAHVVKGQLGNEIFTALLFSPRVFELAGTTNAEIDASLQAHMNARIGIVSFAAAKKYTFGAGPNFRMNPAFWNVTSAGASVKPGVDRQKAIEDLNVHPNDYAIACFAATKLTMEGGSKSPALFDGSSSDVSDWIPGDWGYIQNIKFPPPGSSSPGIPGLEGENIIYTGKDLFWGHFKPGLEYKTLKGWIDEVNSFTPPTEARLLNQRTHTTVGLT